MGRDLETLMTLRQRALDEAESGLSTACRERALRAAEHARAREVLSAAREAVSARVQVERERQAQGFRGGQWVDERRYQVRLRERRAQAETTVRSEATRVAEAAAAEETARQAVLEAQREIQVLEKHLERQAARQRQLDQRRAENEQDDLVNARHGR